MLNMKNFAGLVFLTAGLASAHLVDSSLIPKGGETIKVGDVVSVSWIVETAHRNGIDIGFSKDGGTTWPQKIKTGYEDTDDGSGNPQPHTFKWTVPADAVTTKGKLRICQSGPCSDAQNTSKASGNTSPWYLVSGTFTVQSATGIVSSAADANPISVDFHPETRNVDVSFALTETQAVSLQAYDAGGRLVATLVQGNYGSGAHNLSVFSNRLLEASGTLVFRLQVGDQVKTHTWMSVR
jgi:hypothetical protein